MTSLPSRFRRNVVSNYLNTTTLTIVALVATPILVHGLGRVEYGIWVLVGSTVAYFDLFNLGFGRASVKYVAQYRAVGDEDAVRRTMATAFGVLAVPAAIALAVGVGLAFAIPTLFHIPSHYQHATTLLVILISVDIACSVPSDVFGGALTAYQRYDLLNATVIAVLLLQTAAWAILLALGYGIVALGIATAALGLAGQLARFLLVRRLVPHAGISPRLFDRELVRPLARLSGWMALADAGRVVIARIDTVIVAAVVGVPAAGIYAVGQKLALLAARVVLAASQMFYPHASHLSAQRDEQGLRALLVRGTNIVMAVAIPIALVLGILAKPALHAWVGPRFDQARLVVVYLAAATVAKALTDTAMNVLRGTGNVKPHALIVTFEATLNFVLSIVLGMTMGLTGVALATLIGAAVSNMLLLLPYTCRYVGVPIASLVGGLVRRHAAPIAATLAVGIFALDRDDVRALPFVALWGAIMIATYGVVYALTSLTGSERRDIVGRFRHQSAG